MRTVAQEQGTKYTGAGQYFRMVSSAARSFATFTAPDSGPRVCLDGLPLHR